MKYCLLLSLLVALGCMHTHGAPVNGMEDGSCGDPKVVELAEEALNRINRHRKEGYILSLHRLSNVHTEKLVSDGTVHCHLNLYNIFRMTAMIITQCQIF